MSSTGKSSSIVRVAIASWIGTSIEWYDFFLYGTAAALVLGPLFFDPKLSPLAAQLSAFATFWVGFAARPVGGVVFGHFGDRLGRKTMLVLTLLIMGVATFLVGCLPTFKDIGIFAPILLVILRFAQGFAVGGEWGGAVLMATEHSPSGRRGFFGSWPQLGVPIGLLLSSLVFSFVSTTFSKDFLTFAWRIPFLLSAVLVAVGLFIRLSISETPEFERVKATRTVARMPVVDVLRTSWRTVLLAMGAFFVTNGAFYIFITFVINPYGKTVLKLPTTTMLNATLIGAVAMGVTILLAGALSDRIGRLPVYLFGAAFVGLMAFPVFWLIDTKSTLLIDLALALGIGGIGIMYGPQAAFFSELFGANVRYSGASIGYQVTAIFAGGPAPFVATALLAQYHNASWPIALYIIGMAVVTFICTFLAGETRSVPAAEVATGAGGV